jgi:hypothetical protein
MVQYRYVHISDIHFGQERYGDKPIHDDVRVELLRDCANFRQSIGPANGILVTGDVAYSGKREQFQIAGAWLDQLADSVGCADTAVSVIPGNHDIDIANIGTTCKMVQNALRSIPLDQLDGMLQSIGKDDDIGNPLLPKLAAYREFSERYGCDFKPDQDQPKRVYPYWDKYLQLDDLNKLCFIGMTSVLVSDLGDAEGTMVLGNQQYIINREVCTEFIVMMHHPLPWFRDHEKINNYLKRARVVLCGHEHSLQVHEIKHEDGATLWIHAGSTNSPEDRDPYQYRYNWIEFAFHVNNNKAYLEVNIYPRIWDSDLTKFKDDVNLLQGRDSMVFHLACPEFQIPVHEPVLMVKDFSKEAIAQVNKGEVQEIMNDEEPFTRLRYLFWKYLDWSARLKVLADLDVLPSNLSQPIPQIMERLALKNARDEGKLSAIWEAVMAFVPEGQREPNPFLPKE